ncbi:MAG: helix-turn-helix domain-containing protein [Thiohalocapsa sp.]|jgi:AraC-like DNA-binding protein
MDESSQLLGPLVSAMGPPDEAGRACKMRVDQRRPDFVSGLPLRESESVQLGPGNAEYRSHRVLGRDLVLLSYSVAPQLRVHSVPQTDWVVLIMSLNPRSGFVFNGRETRAGELSLATGGDGYMTLGSNRRNLAVGVRKHRLVHACAALAGIGPEDVPLQDCVLMPERDPDRRLRRALVSAAGPVDGAPTSPGQFAMPPAVESDLLSLLAAQLRPLLCRAPDASPFRLDALRVVRAAMALTKTHPAPSLAEMCAAAGVGQRWLHKCFTEVVGMPPYRYVRLARLSKAREQLLASDGDSTLVKTLSLSLGYRLSGRFASEYRSVFGENPSTTLQDQRCA